MENTFNKTTQDDRKKTTDEIMKLLKQYPDAKLKEILAFVKTYH